MVDKTKSARLSIVSVARMILLRREMVVVFEQYPVFLILPETLGRSLNNASIKANSSLL